MFHHLPSFSLYLDFPLGFHNEIIEIIITSLDSYSFRAGRELILICHFEDEEMEAENGQARSCGRAGVGGFDLKTLRSRLEPKSRVRCSTD